MSHIMHFIQFSGPFHRLPVISKFVASSDEWCDNNAFAKEQNVRTPMTRRAS
jgi:hypothetical protein